MSDKIMSSEEDYVIVAELSLQKVKIYLRLVSIPYAVRILIVSPCRSIKDYLFISYIVNYCYLLF